MSYDRFLIDITQAFLKSIRLKRCVFKNLRFQWRFHRFRVDGRRKRIEKEAFSNENVLVQCGRGLTMSYFSEAVGRVV